VLVLNLLPEYLIPAFIALGGVLLVLCVYIFHYFGDRVNQRMLEKTKEFLSSAMTRDFLQKIEGGSVPSVVIKDFAAELLKIGEPRKTFRDLLLFSPITGVLFIFSACLATLTTVQNEFMRSIADSLELVADLALLGAIILLIYCAFKLVKLTRELA